MKIFFIFAIFSLIMTLYIAISMINGRRNTYSIITKILPIMVVTLVGLIISSELINSITGTNTTNNLFSLKSTEISDYHTTYTDNISNIEPIDTNQYKTEEINYDNILDDLGEGYMNKYENNVTNIMYDDNLDILGGI